MVKAINRAMVVAIAFAVTFAALTPLANAGCRQFVRSYHHVAAVQFVAPVVLYQAGSDLQAQALADKVVRLAQQQLKADAPQTVTAPAAGILTQRCASCHNGTKAFDFEGGLSDSHKVRWMEMLAFGKDVPAEMKPLIEKIKAEGSGADVTDAVILSAKKPDEGVLQ